MNGGVPSRRELNAQRTRNEIIDAATALFGDRGFHEVSIDDIRAAVGLSRGGFYHHFANREQVFEAVWRRLQDEWAAHTERLAADYTGDDVWELVEQSLHDLFAYWAEPRRRRINFSGPMTALGVERSLELSESNGQAQVTDMLRLLGKRHDPINARLIYAAITDATFQVGHPDRVGDAADAARALVDLIRGMPDDGPGPA